MNRALQGGLPAFLDLFLSLAPRGFFQGASGGGDFFLLPVLIDPRHSFFVNDAGPVPAAERTLRFDEGLHGRVESFQSQTLRAASTGNAIMLTKSGKGRPAALAVAIRARSSVHAL